METTTKGTIISISKEASVPYTRRDGSDGSFEYKEVTINTSPDPQRPWYITGTISTENYGFLAGIAEGDEAEFKVKVGGYKLSPSRRTGSDSVFNKVSLLFIKKLA